MKPSTYYNTVDWVGVGEVRNDFLIKLCLCWSLKEENVLVYWRPRIRTFQAEGVATANALRQDWPGHKNNNAHYIPQALFEELLICKLIHFTDGRNWGTETLS